MKDNFKEIYKLNKHFGRNVMLILLIITSFDALKNVFNLVLISLFSRNIVSGILYKNDILIHHALRNLFPAILLGIFILMPFLEIIIEKKTLSVLYRIKSIIFTKLSSIQFNFLEKRSYGKIDLSISHDTDQLDLLLRQGFSTIASPIAVGISSIVLLLHINWILIVPIFVFSTIQYIIFPLIIKKMKWNDMRTIFETQASLLNNTYKGIKGIKIFGSDLHSNKFNDLAENRKSLDIYHGKIMGLMMGIGTVLSTLSRFCVITLAVLFGDIDAGELIMISYLSIQALRSFTGISNFIGMNQQMFLSIKNINEFMNIPNESKPGNFNISETDNIYNIKNCSFSYKNESNYKLILKSIEINRGDFVCIKGESGQGKSTLLKILLGLYDEELQGEININKDFYSNDIKKYRQNIAYLNQNPPLLNDTISNNFSLSSEIIDKSLLVNKLKNNGLDRLIQGQLLNRIIKDYDTKNILLSTGEVKRIAIARLVFLDRRILFFDEPTSSLDSELEQIFIDFLKSQNSKKTILIASHNKKIEEISNKILTINKGVSTVHTHV